MQVEQQLTLTINGKLVCLKQVSPTLTLLEYLRQSGRVGTKEGCGDGDCGACTVVLVGEGTEGQAQYQAVNSCLIPLGAVAGRSIITVEGIADEQPHPVQAAMIQTGGSQCGYCTPGFIMSLFAAYYHGKVNGKANGKANGKVEDVAVEGNLCRCTGYLAIRRAARLLTQAAPNDRFTTALAQATLELPSLHYQTADQQFYRPQTLSDVLALLQAHPEAVLVAGATDLGLEMSHHRRSFPVMISLEAVRELQQLEITADGVEIGAALPLTQLEERLHGIFPSLDTMLHWFAARQVRNRATLGGNLGTASPIGDLPPVLLSLDAEVKLASLTGERWVPLAAFFTGYRQTVRRSEEVIVSVRIPRLLPAGAAKRFSQSYKIGKRGTDDISIVAAAFTVDLDANDRIVQARLAYGGVAATPIRATTVETMLVGQPWQAATIAQTKPLLRTSFAPLSDLRGSADYRKFLIASLFEKFFVEMTSSDQAMEAGV